MSGNRCSNHKKHVNNCIKCYCTIIFVHTVNISTKHTFYLMLERKTVLTFSYVELFNVVFNAWMKFARMGKNISIKLLM